MGIISNSGSLTNLMNIMGRTTSQWGIRFSKVVCLGSECDLTCTDFLTYLGSDPETDLIGCYLEGIKDGPRFINALRKASLKKPVILWKCKIAVKIFRRLFLKEHKEQISTHILFCGY